MVFCVITDENVSDKSTLPECDVAVYGFYGLGEVNYERELKGETEKFEEAARLSKNSACGLVCGCKTVSRGLKRKSVSVSDIGKLVGIAYLNQVVYCENYKSGASLGYYNINGCNVGICIENDLLFPDTFKSLAMCGCSVIVAVLEEVRDCIPPLLIRAYAYLYGVPIVMCAGKTAYFADISGAIATSTQGKTLFEIAPRSSYHIVTTRRRGITADDRLDF